MEQILRNHVNRLQGFINEITNTHRKPSYEIDLSRLSNLMCKVGFKGPINRPGSAKAFSHEFLLQNPMLHNGYFTVHTIHRRNTPTILYRDFKQYILPNILEVIQKLEEMNLIKEDN